MSKVSVTSAEFQRNFGRYREAAIKEAVTITLITAATAWCCFRPRNTAA